MKGVRKVLQIAHLGLGAPAEHHHVAPVHPEYYKLPFMKQNIAEAKKLLAEAGKPNGFDCEIFCKKDPDWEAIAVSTRPGGTGASAKRAGGGALPNRNDAERNREETRKLANSRVVSRGTERSNSIHRQLTLILADPNFALLRVTSR